MDAKDRDRIVLDALFDRIESLEGTKRHLEGVIAALWTERGAELRQRAQAAESEPERLKFLAQADAADASAKRWASR